MRLRWALATVCALVPIAVLAPLLGRGFTLSYDMVFVPRQDLGLDDLGLGTTLPRAVPSDAVVALATIVLPGEVLQWLVLVALLAGACLGAGLAVPSSHPAARCTAAVAYGWNPYVAERLVQGHWALLAGYAALPWVLCAARDVRACRPRAGARLVLAMAVAALTPTGGLLATGLAAAVLGWPGPDRDVRTLRRQLAVAVLLNAPWWLPALLRPGGSTSDPAGVDAFAARAESWAGSLGSLLGLGGIWNAEAVPASRTLATAPLLTAVGLLVAAAGWTPLLRASRSIAVPLAAVAGGGLLVALAGSVAPGRAALRWAVEHVAGAGLLRDGQRLVAPLALLLALCVGMAAERLLTRLAGHPAAASAVAALLLTLPVVGTPDLAWGVGGRLAPASYPPDWAAVRAELAHAPEPGDVVVLPFGAFRAYGWNGGRTVLDPAPRAFGREVVVDDRLVVGGREVAGEDPRAAAVRHALDTGQPLGPLGIGWVVMEEGVPGAVPAAALAGAEQRYAGPDLELHRLPGYAPATWPRPPVVPVVVADLAAGTAVLAAAGLALPARRRKGGKPAVRAAPGIPTGW